MDHYPFASLSNHERIYDTVSEGGGEGGVIYKDEKGVPSKTQTFQGHEETAMIVYKMVTKEQDGRLVSLMEKGKRQIEYRPGQVTYPPVGILYARDSLEAALQAVKEYKAGEIPTAELWEAEATGVTDIGYSTIVGCASLKLIKKLYPIEP